MENFILTELLIYISCKALENSDIVDNIQIDNEEPDSLSVSSNIKKNTILDNQSSSITFNTKLKDANIVDKQTKILFKATYQKETISDNMKAGISVKRED